MKVNTLKKNIKRLVRHKISITYSLLKHYKTHLNLGCINGYEYDKTWFQNTIITQENWVCEKDLFKTNAFVFDRIGEVIGTFIFGQLGDTYIFKYSIL